MPVCGGQTLVLCDCACLLHVLRDVARLTPDSLQCANSNPKAVLIDTGDSQKRDIWHLRVRSSIWNNNEALAASLRGLSDSSYEKEKAAGPLVASFTKA